MNKQASRVQNDNRLLETLECQLCDVIRCPDGMMATVEGFELHWQVRDWQRDGWEKHVTSPGPKVLYIVWDFKENINLPMLPKEMNGIYYARARLCASMCTLRLWTADPSKTQFRTYTSRVLEKSCAYALAILRDALLSVDLEGVEKVVIWPDRGSSFNTYIVLGTIAAVLMKDFRSSTGHGFEWEINYGPEMHFKMLIDAYFAYLQGVLQTISKSEAILDVPDVTAALTRHCAAQADVLKDTPSSHGKEVFLTWSPPEKSTVSLMKLTPKYLLAKLNACYSWTFKLVDHRRKSLFGLDRSRLTAVQGACRMLTGMAADDRRFTPVVENVRWSPGAELKPTEPEESEEEEEGEVQDGGATPEEQAKVIDGWRTSYRCEFPESA